MTTARPRLRVLLLCDDHRSNANTVLDHIHSFRKYSRHNVKTFNPRGVKRSRMLDFNEFDAVVIHWSLSLIHDHYLHWYFRDRLAAFSGLKVQFLQDDYRWVDRMTAEQRRIGIKVLFTLVSPEHFDKIWTERLPGVRLVSTLAGYVPDELLGRPTTPVAERELDIVYRGREVPWWLGRLGQDKVLVGRGVKARAQDAGLKVDVAWTEGDRIYGERWIEFLGNSRTTIGCEGGASITDFDGSIEAAAVDYRKANPDASFDEGHAAVLAPYEGNVPMNVMTPRLFEAAALKTALVLFPGRYSDRLEPWRHYIPLEKDFSNFDEVARLIKDDAFLTELAERTFSEVAAAPENSLRSMVAEFDRVVDEEGHRRAFRPIVGYELATRQDRVARLLDRQRIAVIEAFAKTFAAELTRPLTSARVVRYPGHYATRAYVALRATVRSRDRSALVARSLVPSRARNRPRFDVLLEDMLKIDILSRGQHSPRRGMQQFKVWPHLHADGVLELRSRPGGAVDAEATEIAAVLSAIESGVVTSVEWNHSEIANRVYQPVLGKRRVAVFLGPDGRHDFATLRHLLERDRRMAARVLRPAMPAPPKRRSERRRLKLPALPSQTRRLVRDLVGYLRRAYVMSRLILPNRGYRRVVRRYLADPRLRSAAPVYAVLGDILRLDALNRCCTTANGVGVRLEYDAVSGQWSYVTTRGVPGEPLRARPSADLVSHVTWDNSAVSDTLTVHVGVGKPIKVSLGSDGVYEFTSLPLIARYEPRLVASILPVPAGGADQVLS